MDCQGSVIPPIVKIEHAILSNPVGSVIPPIVKIEHPRKVPFPSLAIAATPSMASHFARDASTLILITF